MDLKVDPSSPLPLHAQVERLLRQLIATPESRAGARLPDELSLAKTLGISRNTVRTAMERLVRDGLIQRRRGVGSHVAQSQVASHSTAWNEFLGDLEPRGPEVVVLQVHASHVVAPPEVETALQLPGSTSVLTVQRLLGGSAGPIGRVTSWLHPRLSMQSAADYHRPFLDAIELDAGVIPVRASEEVSAELADAALARELQMKRHGPVLVRKRIVLDSQRQPIEFAIAWYRADRLRRQLEITRDHSR